MCQSFTELSLDRQEKIWVDALYYASDESDGAYRAEMWTERAAGYRLYLKEERYAVMSQAELEEHAESIRAAHGSDVDWRPVLDTVTRELRARADAQTLERAAKLIETSGWTLVEVAA